MKIRPKQFTGKENHSITVIEAIDFIKKYKKHYPGSASGCYADADTIKTLIDQPKAVGMRYYYIQDANSRKGLVLVGTDANRQDLLQEELVKLAMFNPPFTPKGQYDCGQLNHNTALEDTSKLTAAYRENATSEVKGGFFGKEALHALLAQKDCVGIHFLYGAKADGTPVMVMMGVDKFGATMFFGQLMELSSQCPPDCGKETVLTTDSEHLTKEAGIN